MAKNSLPDNGKPRKSIEDMNLQEIQAYNKELLAKIEQLLAERRTESEQAEPQPQLVPERKAKLPTKRMAKAMERFDNMTDSEQVDSLLLMW